MSIGLDRCDGPSCPRCGCQDARILRWPPVQSNGQSSWWDQGEAACRHCGTRFHFRETTVAKASPQNHSPADRVDPLPDAESPPDTPDAHPPDRHVVRYHVIHCPHCGSNNTKVRRTMKPIRYHKCDDCGETFKSVEAAGGPATG